MEECTDASYWKGLWHGLLLMVPILSFLYRKWTVAAARAPTPQPQQLGSFMNELFSFEVVLVAGAELKAVRDQLKNAQEQTPVNDKKVQALKERVVDVATVLQQKLETITPIVSFLLEQSVSVIKDDHAEKLTAGEEPVEITKEDAEPKKTK